MLRTLNTLLAVRMFSLANRFIYYAQKLPLVGARVPDKLYAGADAKRAIVVLAWIANVLWGIANKFAYLGLLVYVPAVTAGGSAESDHLKLFLHVFALLSFVVAGISAANILEPKREKYVAVKLMRMVPAAYMRTTLGYRYLTYFVYYIPALAVFLALLGQPFYQALALAATLTLWRVWCELLHVKLFERTGMVLIKNVAIVWATILLGYAAAYLPLLREQVPMIGGILLQWPFVAAVTALGLYAAARLAKYPDYRAVVDAASKRDDPMLDFSRAMSEAQKSSVETKESDYAATEAESFQRREGYAYLNALFFSRHRRLVRLPFLKRLAIAAGIGVLGAVVGALGNDDVAGFLTSNAENALGYLPIAFSLLTVGEVVTRAMFYHCDLSMLRYGFYRQAAPQHFRIRLLRILGYNAAIGIAMGAGLTLTAFAAGGVSGQLLLAMWVAVLALSAFFSVHHLFMYYIFQPFSTELNVKNPFYFAINMLVSAACGFSLVIHPPAEPFALGVLIGTAVYAVAAVFLVGRFGRRTFRVK